MLKLGQRQKTAKGSVIVYAYDGAVPATASQQPAQAGDVFVAFDVEGCAGANADAHTGLTAAGFYLQLDLKHPAYNAVSPVKQPALHDTALAPGRCARGWITFEIPRSLKPQFILFRGRPATAWRVPPK